MKSRRAGVFARQIPVEMVRVRTIRKNFSNTGRDIDNEIKNLHRKVKAGTDFFLTQPVYNPGDGPKILEAYEAKHGKLNKPILAGILPLVSIRHANFLHNEVPGIFIPDEVRERIEAAGEEGVKAGVEIAVELAEVQGLGGRRIHYAPVPQV